MLLRVSGKKALVLGNAEGTEQIFIGKVHGFHPGGFEQDAGENVQTNRPIVKFLGDAVLSAKEIQRRLRPVLTGTHLRPWVAMPLIGGAHGQQMPDRYIKDRLLAALDLILRKVGKHPIIHTADHLMVNSDADQQRHHAFRRGRDMDAVRPLIAVPAASHSHVFIFVSRSAGVIGRRYLLSCVL